MAARRSYETKLYDDLKKLEDNRWYKIADRKDHKRMVETIKAFIDTGSHFEFSDNYHKVRRVAVHTAYECVQVWHNLKTLPEGMRVEKIKRGTQHTYQIKNKPVTVTQEGDHYLIYHLDQLVAIEN